MLFVVYCIDAGLILLLWPWLAAWDKTWSQLPWYALRHFGLTPLARAVVSGFGAIHLVWGAHDFDLWLRQFRR